MRFLVDEDLPRSLARVIRAAGFDAEDVRDVGLRGHSDAEVYQFALEHQRTVITADLGFADVRAYPLGEHAGLIVTRFANETPIVELNAAVVNAINSLANDDIRGALIIVDPRRIRIRRMT